MTKLSITQGDESPSKYEKLRNKKRARAKKTIVALFVAFCCLFALSLCVFFSVDKASIAKQALSKQNQTAHVHNAWEHPSSPNRADLRHMAPSFDQWSNQYSVVHVIQMRFNQFQPNLLHLGHARLSLFHTITLPSILHQSSQQFLLIIRTDPDLHPELKEPLLATLRHVPNAVLVGSNELVEGFREVGMRDINETTILSGNLGLVQSYHDNAQTHIVLETRLDADDALALTFVDSIQRKAHDTWVSPPPRPPLHPKKTINGDDDEHAVGDDAEGVGYLDGEENLDDAYGVPECDYRVWCAGPSISWHFYNPWDKQSMLGILVPTPSTKACITPGLTFGFQTKAKFIDLAVRQHQLLHRHIPNCKHRPFRCLERLSGGGKGEEEFVALRARGPTSAGMKDVVLTMTNTSTNPHGLNVKTSHEVKKALRDELSIQDKQADYWNNDAFLTRLFGVSAMSVWAMRLRMEANLPAILADALRGQCTEGHSCKSGTNSTLRGLLNMSLGVTTATVNNNNNKV